MPRGSGARVLAAVLFTDIVDSTTVASRLGDSRWKELVARHHAIVRRELKRFGGREFDTAGDGFFAGFKEPAPAIRAACAISEAVRDLGVEIRAGVHFGECEQAGSKLSGIAVVVGSRVMSLGTAGDVLVTATTRDLVAGAGFGFGDRGDHSLKGVDGQWHVFNVTEVDGTPRPEPAPASVAEERLSAVHPSSVLSRSWMGAHRIQVVVAGIVAIGLIAAVLPSLRSGARPIDVGTNSIARLDGEDGSLEFATALGQRPGATAIGFNSLWVAEPDQGVVARLNLEDGAVVDTIPVGASPAGVAVGEGSVWVTNAGEGTVLRIDPDTNTVSDRFPVGTGPSGIAVGDGALWVTDPVAGELLRVDPGSGESRPVPDLAGRPAGIAFAPDGLWSSFAPSGIARVDTAGPTVTFTETVGSGPTAVLAAFDSIWVANHLDGTVSRMDPTSGRKEQLFPVGEGPAALGATTDTVWVANEFGASITAIDPATNEVERTLPVGGSAVSLSIDGDHLWLAVGASATEHRGGTFAVATSERAPATLDPAFSYLDPFMWGLLAVTNDGLVSYKKVGGPDGATLVPDLASELPQVSEGGLTYRFPLREGIFYSSGEPVRPEDFRFSLERAMSLSLDARAIFGTLRGAKACREDTSPCDLRDAISTTAEAVTFHLARPDPDLPYKLALPLAVVVPASTPVMNQRMEPIPATGPYMIDEAGPDKVGVVRNPTFHEWSGAAQPDGFVDAIAFAFRQDVSNSFDRIVGGQLDWMLDTPQPDDLAWLEATHPDQLELYPAQWTHYVGMNVAKPPFDDVRVRQALNYAIDRKHVVDLGLLGSAANHLTTCQILPPNFPGYEPYCPYTIDPGDGVWSAPDLGRANALIDAAGATGKKVTVWATHAFNETVPGAVETMKYVVEVLNDLGLDAELKIVPTANEYATGVYSGAAQAYLFGWAPDYPTAGQFVDTQFRCTSPFNAANYCDPSVDAQMDKASRLQETDPAAANRMWTKIEHQIVREAVWAPLANQVFPYAFSDRTENVQINPHWGVLMSRLWVT
jgi:YVTN family beta-propeller protein